MWFFSEKKLHRTKSMSTIPINNEDHSMTSSSVANDSNYKQDIKSKQKLPERKPRSRSMFYHPSNRLPSKQDHHAQFAQSLENEFISGKVLE